MNKCPTFSGRDTEWSEWIFVSMASMANLEPVMEGAFNGLIAAWKRIPARRSWTAHSDAHGGSCSLACDTRGAANTFLDQLTDDGPKKTKGESLETFSDGMQIAVLATQSPSVCFQCVCCPSRNCTHVFRLCVPVSNLCWLVLCALQNQKTLNITVFLTQRKTKHSNHFD